MDDSTLAAVVAHLDRLRARADHLDAIRLHSGAAWLRIAADRLEADVTEPATEGATC